LKAKKHDISVGELFRQKLEGVEIPPEASVSSKLMRRIAMKEFLNFNPFRLNIYYLGFALLTIITAIILIFGSENSDQLNFLNIPRDLQTDSSVNRVDRTVNQKPETLDSKEFVQEIIRAIDKSPLASPADTLRKLRSAINLGVTNADVNNSFMKDGLFSATSGDRTKLQGGFKSGKTLFESTASEGCTPLKLQFYNKSDSFDSCKWTFGDGGYSDEINPEWIFDVAGEYKVILELFGTEGLNETSSATIIVFPKPLARFEIIPVKAVLPDDEIQYINYSTNAMHYNWDFGDGSTSDLFEPRHKYAKTGNYNVRLIVTSAYGCTDSLFVRNAFSGSEYFINFPNAFIPNSQGPLGGYYSSTSDESAQIFHPAFNGVSVYQLKIFSKQGIQIFESRDLNIGWDGYLNGQLSASGVYIWKVRGNFRNGEPFTRMGDVTLLGNDR
jgi:PKD repeat protein